MFSPAVLGLLRLLSARPGGVSREELRRLMEGTPPEWVDRTLARLLEVGVVAERDGLVVPLPALKELTKNMELLAARLNQCAKKRDQAMELVKLILRGPAG